MTIRPLPRRTVAAADARLRHPCLGGDDPHNGSDDLEEFPPSSVELHMAGRVAVDGDLQAWRHLSSLAVSRRRAVAILRHVERAARAQGVLDRVALR